MQHLGIISGFYRSFSCIKKTIFKIRREIMQEWVDTLRQKLREMKILSPKENLYSKLPEIRAPLLPTRDPTSPLPAPPPVPAAIVPGIEQVIPTPSNVNTTTTTTTSTTATRSTATTTSTATSTSAISNSSETTTTTTLSSHPVIASTSSLPATAMSNTLTQNLINMLTNPVTMYSSHVTNIIDTASDSSGASINDDNFFFDDDSLILNSPPTSINTSSTANRRKSSDTTVVSLAKTFSNNVLADPNTCPSTSGLNNNHSAAMPNDRNDHETDPGKKIISF